jgi:glycerol uptake facilitator-like aquaporin
VAGCWLLCRRANHRRNPRGVGCAFDVRAAAVAGLLALAHGQWLAEFIATFGLPLAIFGSLARNPAAVPYAVGLYITSAYWFSASTSFANPAVTIARSISDTFAGIAPTGVVAFIAAQFIGMFAAVLLGRWLSLPPFRGAIKWGKISIVLHRLFSVEIDKIEAIRQP